MLLLRLGVQAVLVEAAEAIQLMVREVMEPAVVLQPLI
jgi:hypothetical protein